jgi:hypothetical protein
MLNVMVLHTLIVFASALPVLGTPDSTRTDGSPTELVEKVTALHTAGSYAEAAKLADNNARRDDLDAVTRVILGGLAQQNYGLSYKPGGSPAPLCRQAAILRHVAPLDTAENGAAKIKEAVVVEERLAATLGPTWPAACAASPMTDTRADEDVAAEGASLGSAQNAADAAVAPTPQAQDKRPGPPPTDRLAHRRFRAGVGTLVPGLLLLAPMAGLLVHRAAGERDFLALLLDTTTRTPTEEDDKQVEALNQRHAATTAGAVAFGLTGGALVVTGVALLASGTRQRRVSVAPWGARGLGGFVLQGRF